jgi:hypothetical protein
MELSTIRYATSCDTTEELPSVLWNPKIHDSINRNPSTGPYPETNKSSQTHAPEPYQYYQPTHDFVFLEASFFLDFHQRTHMTSLMLHVLLISSFFISSLYLYSANSTSYEVPHFAGFFNLLSLNLSSVQISDSASWSRTP